MADESPFTPGQWEAARMLVARLRSEALQEPFTYESIGLEWLPVEDLVCARTDKGVEIRTSDVITGGIILLWSVLVEQSMILDDESPLEAVARLGLGLANSEPASR